MQQQVRGMPESRGMIALRLVCLERRQSVEGRSSSMRSLRPSAWVLLIQRASRQKVCATTPGPP